MPKNIWSSPNTIPRENCPAPPTTTLPPSLWSLACQGTPLSGQRDDKISSDQSRSPQTHTRSQPQRCADQWAVKRPSVSVSPHLHQTPPSLTQNPPDLSPRLPVCVCLCRCFLWPRPRTRWPRPWLRRWSEWECVCVPVCVRERDVITFGTVGSPVL